MPPIATGSAHAAPGFFLGLLRGTLFLHGLGRFFLALLLTVHALAHCGRSLEEDRCQIVPDDINDTPVSAKQHACCASAWRGASGANRERHPRPPAHASTP